MQRTAIVLPILCLMLLLTIQSSSFVLITLLFDDNKLKFKVCLMFRKKSKTVRFYPFQNECHNEKLIELVPGRFDVAVLGLHTFYVIKYTIII